MLGTKGTCRSGVLVCGILALFLVLAACAPAVSDAEIISYQRSGGIAGFLETLVVRQDRSATIESFGETWEFEIDPERYEMLIELFDTANFLTLQEEYLPDSNCCDLFDYTIRYRGHTVHTMTTAVPVQIEPILLALNDLVSEHIVR